MLESKRGPPKYTALTPPEPTVEEQVAKIPDIEPPPPRYRTRNSHQRVSEPTVVLTNAQLREKRMMDREMRIIQDRIRMQERAERGGTRGAMRKKRYYGSEEEEEELSSQESEVENEQTAEASESDASQKSEDKTVKKVKIEDLPEKNAAQTENSIDTSEPWFFSCVCGISQPNYDGIQTLIQMAKRVLHVEYVMSGNMSNV
jgi:hypothetical protein